MYSACKVQQLLLTGLSFLGHASMKNSHTSTLSWKSDLTRGKTNDWFHTCARTWPQHVCRKHHTHAPPVTYAAQHCPLTGFLPPSVQTTGGRELQLLMLVVLYKHTAVDKHPVARLPPTFMRMRPMRGATDGYDGVGVLLPCCGTGALSHEQCDEHQGASAGSSTHP